MNDLINATKILKDKGATLVACRGEESYISFKSGIAPMVEALSTGQDLKGFSVADKVVGRAAAMLFCLAGIKAVYADLVSEGAVEYLKEHKVPLTFDKITPLIRNRSDTGPCPMEEAVLGENDPKAAFDKILKRLKELNSTPKKT